jgi:hydrogenase expression/formation protein HypC
MCLAIPARVEALHEAGLATIDLGGIRKQVSVELLEDVRPGDYVIVHVGYALQKLDPEAAARTLAVFAGLEARSP